VFGQLNWKLTACLIAGLPAKEAIYSTLVQVSLGIEGIKTIFNYNLSISFMVFILYYIPCFPTIKVMFDEIH
jgi:Fe2+ transport system protein B